MLVMNILDDKETSNIVNNGVLVCWVVVDRILIFSIVTNRVLEL